MSCKYHADGLPPVYQRATDYDNFSHTGTRKEVLAQQFEHDNPGVPAPRDTKPKATTTGEVPRTLWTLNPKHANPTSERARETHQKLLDGDNSCDHQKVRKELVLQAGKSFAGSPFVHDSSVVHSRRRFEFPQ